MGPTGAGTSTVRAPCFNDVFLPDFTQISPLQFINTIAGKEVTTAIGHDLKSCTANLLPVFIGSLQSDLLNDGRLVLLDSPGFDVNPNVNGAVILDGIQVGSWLETMYDSCDSHWHKGKRNLAGIVL